MYEIMYNHLEKENADLCRIKAFIYNIEGGIEEISKERNVFIYSTELEIMNAYLKNELKIAVWDKLFRTETVKDLVFDDKLFNEDVTYVWEAHHKNDNDYSSYVLKKRIRYNYFIK